MNLPLTIDLSQFPVNDPYNRTLPVIQAGIGDHTVQIQVLNVPLDQTSMIDRYKKSAADYAKQSQEHYDNYCKVVEQVEQLKADLREARNAGSTSEDRPRPPLPNETLQVMLQLMNGGRNYTEVINQVQVIRLLTGWGLREAQGFVNSNRPAAATEE